MPEEAKKDTQKKKQAFNYQYFLQTRKFLAITIGLAALSAFVALTILFPNIQKVRDISSKLKTERNKLANLQRKNNTLQNVQTTDLYSKKDAINAILPSSKPLLQLLNQIDRVSSENQVIVSEFGVVPGEISTPSAQAKESAKPVQGKNPNIDFIETKLVIVGKIDNINAFLKDINDITPITETTELSFKGVNRQDLFGQGDNSHVFEATLALTSYFFVGKIQTEANQDLPDLSKFTEEEIAQLDQFQIPISSQQPVSTTVEGGGKTNLFSGQVITRGSSNVSVPEVTEEPIEPEPTELQEPEPTAQPTPTPVPGI